MVDFEIQEIKKVKSYGAKCLICRKLIPAKIDGYRVKFGKDLFHLNCFYKYINRKISKSTQNEEKFKEYSTYIYLLNKHIPQILAEELTKNNNT